MGLCASFAQCSTSFNSRRGTLRGLHWQDEPYAEVKLVRCTRGAIFDVAVDLRPESETLRRWVGVELTEANGNQLYLPAGVAHGFQTLTDNAEVFYQITPAFSAEHAKGARWDDSAFNITWPIDQPILSRRDASFPWVDPRP